MRTSPKREPFDPSKYKKHFLQIMDEFHYDMEDHFGRRNGITRREYTVEMSYLFPRATTDIHQSGLEDVVVLNLSHDKNGVFTKNHFQDEANKPFQYKTLKEAVDEVGIKYSFKAKMQHLSSMSRPEGVNVVAEVRKALERANCKNVEYRQINYAAKFTGNYFGIEFMCNVYTKRDGRLNTTLKKGKDGNNVATQNPVWDYPKVPPAALAREIARVIAWVKDAEAGLFTSSEIAEGPNGIIASVDSLGEKMMKLSLKI